MTIRVYKRGESIYTIYENVIEHYIIDGKWLRIDTETDGACYNLDGVDFFCWDKDP